MRRRGSQIPLFNINGSFVKHVPLREAFELQAAASARILERKEHGKPRVIYGAQLLVAVTAGTGGTPSISKSEIHANAMAKTTLSGAQSRTSGMFEHSRVANRNPRTLRIEEEDFVERVETKVATWPLIGDIKAPLVRPRADLESLHLAAAHASMQAGEREASHVIRSRRNRAARIEHIKAGVQRGIGEQGENA
jgi:hypothetical protein